MNAYRKGNKYLAFIFAALMALAAVAVVAAEETDAGGVTWSNMKDSGFTANKTGTLTVPVVSDASQDITVTVKEQGSTVATKTFEAVEGSADLGISFSLGAGTHDLIVYVTMDGSTVSGSYELSVKTDIWANVGTYIAIIIVVIVVIVILVLYMRARPNNKPTTTFTQLEEEKKAAAANKNAEAKPASKTEKVKYTSSRRK